MGSNLYFTSTQNVPIDIKCSKKLLSFNPDLRLGVLLGSTSEDVSLSTTFGGGFDPNQQLGIKLQGTISVAGGGGTKTPVKSLDEEQKNNINKANEVLKLAGFKWQSRVAMLCVSGKESGLKPKAEYGYGTTGEEGLRHLFGKYLTEFDTQEKLYKLSGYNTDGDRNRNQVEFYDYIYGYKTTPQRSGTPPNGGNDQPGDGYKYRGRGLNQITFKNAYRDLTTYARGLGGAFANVDYLANPDDLNIIDHAAMGLAWFMNKAANGNNKSRYSEYSGENVNPKEGTNMDVLIHFYCNANAGFGHDWTSEHVIEAYNNAKAYEQILTSLYTSTPELQA